MAAAKKKTKAETSDVYQAYGEGLEALFAGKFKEAHRIFEELEQKFPAEVELLARSRSFMKVCSRRLSESSSDGPKLQKPEEYYDLGVWHHNRGQYKEAIKHFEKALEVAGEDLDYVHYGLAASKARLGDGSEAIESLKKATSLRSESRFLAAQDPDFEQLTHDGDFRSLLGS